MFAFNFKQPTTHDKLQHLRQEINRSDFSSKRNGANMPNRKKTSRFVPNNNIRNRHYKSNSKQSSLFNRIMSRQAYLERIAAQSINMKESKYKAAFEGSVPREHEKEAVAVIEHVAFVNDSRSTNINSTWFTISNIEGPIIWIAGGVDKGNDYRLIMEQLPQIKAIILIGQNNVEIIRALTKEDRKYILCQPPMQGVVNLAQSMAKAGDTVLLSPACASFDYFENYEHRGQEFRAAVKRL